MGPVGGWRRIGEYPGQVGMNCLCLLMLEDDTYVLRLLEGCFTEVGWHATFERVCQLSDCCYDPVLGCDVQVGDIFVLVEHRGRYLCGTGVLHPHYP